uniref:Secreted protein n=1 Tax=Thraustotheca clavata TaxID=74557 RepID=A0A0A7CMP8_9STRA|nr:secreted protein [Thraustotheca clavata]
MIPSLKVSHLLVLSSIVGIAAASCGNLTVNSAVVPIANLTTNFTTNPTTTPTTPDTIVFPRNISESWQLTFEDDFNSLDASRWSMANECSTANGCIHNNEKQVYLRSQVYAENGNLVLEATDNEYTSPGNAGVRKYRSGKVDSAQSFAQQYGRFEARIKLPVGVGMWPAFWLMPRGGRCWPTDGEIDIMEYVGQTPNRVYGNYHFGQKCNGNLHYDNSVCGETGRSKQVNLSQDYHVYSVEWTPKSISWFIDGELYYTLDNNLCKKKELFFIPNKPFYIIFNLAVGGDWPGSPNSNTVFPQRMYIDYIRVYQKAFHLSS